MSDIISITESNKEDDDASIDDRNRSAVCASSRVVVVIERVVDEFLLGAPPSRSLRAFANLSSPISLTRQSRKSKRKSTFDG